MKSHIIKLLAVISLVTITTSTRAVAGGGDHGAGNIVSPIQHQQQQSQQQQQQQQQIQSLHCLNGESATLSVDSTFDLDGKLLSQDAIYTCQAPHACEGDSSWQGEVTTVVNQSRQVMSVSTGGKCVLNQHQRQQSFDRTQGSSPDHVASSGRLLLSSVILPADNSIYNLSDAPVVVSLEDGMRIHTGLEKRVGCQGSGCLYDELGAYGYNEVNVGCGSFNKQMQFGAIALVSSQTVVFNQGKLIVVCY